MAGLSSREGVLYLQMILAVNWRHPECHTPNFAPSLLNPCQFYSYSSSPVGTLDVKKQGFFTPFLLIFFSYKASAGKSL